MLMMLHYPHHATPMSYPIGHVSEVHDLLEKLGFPESSVQEPLVVFFVRAELEVANTKFVPAWRVFCSALAWHPCKNVVPMGVERRENHKLATPLRKPVRGGKVPAPRAHLKVGGGRASLKGETFSTPPQHKSTNAGDRGRPSARHSVMGT